MSKTIKLTVNGTSIEANDGTTILQACIQNNIDVPALCYMDELHPEGSCRMCYVEVEGSRNLEPSCSALAREGIAVHTHTEKVKNIRREVLDLVLSTHQISCFKCKKMGQCKLHQYCEEYGVEMSKYQGKINKYEVDSSNPFFDIDRNKCILCRRCVRACNYLQCNGAIALNGRGFTSVVSTAAKKEIEASTCVSCGNCVSNCPTGALIPKRKQSLIGAEKVLTVCNYCGVGCSVYLIVKNGKVIDVEPANGGANRGLLCVKGRFGLKFMEHPDRLKTPLIRKDGVLTEASWEEAYSLITSKILEAKKNHGPNSIMGIGSAKCSNEDNYAFQKMFRAAIGTNNVDFCARL